MRFLKNWYNYTGYYLISQLPAGWIWREASSWRWSLCWRTPRALSWRQLPAAEAPQAVVVVAVVWLRGGRRRRTGSRSRRTTTTSQNWARTCWTEKNSIVENVYTDLIVKKFVKNFQGSTKVTKFINIVSMTTIEFWSGCLPLFWQKSNLKVWNNGTKLCLSAHCCIMVKNGSTKSVT